jgi:hypothetical protein
MSNYLFRRSLVAAIFVAISSHADAPAFLLVNGSERVGS